MIKDQTLLDSNAHQPQPAQKLIGVMGVVIQQKLEDHGFLSVEVEESKLLIGQE